MSLSTIGQTDEATKTLQERRLQHYRIGLIIASFGMNATFFVPLQNLLPRMIETFARPNDQGVVLGIISSIGALVAMIANPIIGHLSDKRVRADGRRYWLALGLALGTAALLALSQQRNLLGVAILWALTQLFLNMAYAPLIASVVDHVPDEEQATIWGYVGVARAVGLVAGFALLAIPPSTPHTGMTAVAILYALCLLPLVLIIGKTPLVQPKPRKNAMTKMSIFGTESAHDFRALLAVRLSLGLASAIALTYLLYYLQDVIHYPRPNEGQAILIGLSTLATVVAAVAVGKLSDRTGKRRPYLVQATLLVIVAGAALALFPTWPMTVLGALAIGTAMGGYASAGQALTVEVLPDPSSTGRDLGVMNIGSVLPQIIGPLFSSLLLYEGVSYRGLFMVAAFFGLAALVMLRYVRHHA